MPTLPRTVAVALLSTVTALLLAACGGDGDGDETRSAGLPNSVPLDRVFAPAIDGRRIVAAEAVPAGAAFAGYERADGSPWAPDDLAAEVGLQEIFRVIYIDADAAQVVQVAVARLDGEAGAVRLLGVTRSQPLDQGESEVAPPAPFGQDAAAATLLDPEAGTDALSLLQGLRGANVAVLEGNVVLRVTVVGSFESNQSALAAAGGIAEVQIGLLADARAGRLQERVGRPFPTLEPDAAAEILGTPPEGFRARPVEIDEDGGLSVQYIAPLGAFVSVTLRLADDPIEALGIGLLLSRSGGATEIVRRGFAVSGVEVLAQDRLILSASIGESAGAAVFEVEIEGNRLFLDVVLFTRGSAFVVVQGVGETPGATPIEAIAADLDLRLTAALSAAGES